MNAIEIRGLEKRFPKSDYLLSLPEFCVHEGYVTGFIGENGAGKTTVMKLLMHMLYADKGEIKIFGHPVSNESLRDEIGYVGEYMGLVDDFSLGNMIKMLKPFYSKWDDKLLEKLLKKFGLTNLKQKYKALSQGKKRQYSLAIVLARRPRLLLLDEPTANLDPLVRYEILTFLSDQLAIGDLTVLFSTHITSDLDRIGDYLYLLHAGQLVVTGEKDKLLEQHCMVKGPLELLTQETKSLFIYSETSSFGFQGLCKNVQEAKTVFGMEAVFEKSTVEDLFLGYTRRERGVQ